MAEIAHEEWRELRSRIDSLASAVFLIAGSALTLSVSILVGLGKEINPDLISSVRCSWLLLMGAIIGFIFLKVSLITQSFLRGVLTSKKFNRIVWITNVVGWGLGLAGLIMFIVGMYAMIEVALAVTFST